MADFRHRTAGWLPAACVAAVIAVYGWIAGRTHSEFGDDPSGAYYNLLVEGFRAGQLGLAKEPPAALAQLTDPYDPAANAGFRGTLFANDRLHDLSYFRGRLYLYFGATPAVLLFWPVVALSGQHLSHQHAVGVFAVLGFVATVALIRSMRRRYFSAAPEWLFAMAVLAAGLATSMPLVLQRPDVWEVAVSCGYALTMLTLLALWRALHAENKARWLALASLTFGLAVSARPNLLPGAVILLVPLLAAKQTLRGDPKRNATLLRLLWAALGPITIVGMAVLVYNQRRFGQVFEFGQHYQLAADRQDQVRHFAGENLWINFRLYFLGAAGWSRVFPFLTPISEPALPPGHGALDFPYGVLTNTPFVLLALAAPLAWRSQPASNDAALRWFAGSVAVLFVITAVTMGLFYGSCVRYELEFSPSLVLLAVGGLFGLEATLRRQIRWRSLALGAAAITLFYSIAFTSLYGLIRRAEVEGGYGRAMLGEDRNDEALVALKKAAWLRPASAEFHFLLGVAWVRTGASDRGREQVVDAARLDRENRAGFLGIFSDELMQANAPDKALEQLQRLAREVPDAAVVHERLGRILVADGRADEAIGRFETAVRLDPNSMEAHVALSRIFSASGRELEAQAHRNAALRIESEAAAAGKVGAAGR